VGRDTLRWVWDAVQDLRYALRTFVKNPGFASVAILTLTLGIGANTAIFALFDAVLLESLPVREPERLVLFSASTGEGTFTGDAPAGRWTLFSVQVYEFLRRQPLPYESLAAVRSGETTVSFRMTGASSEAARTHLVSGNYFTAMGVEPALGRALAADDERPDAPPVAVVSDGFWKQRLHGDSAAIGGVAVLNGTAFTIVGITPPEFFGERVRRPPDFWIPLRFQPDIEQRPSYVTRTDAYWLILVGRLSKGATRLQAQTATTVALQQVLRDSAGSELTTERAREIQAAHVELVDGAGGISGLRAVYSAPLRVLLVVVGLVLLIACANVGNLLLSRAAARRGEIAVRAALGASRARLTRQLLTESLLLATLGAACGVLLAKWLANALLVTVASRTTPLHAQLDARVLAFTAAITVLTGVVFGLAPALQARRTDLVTALKAGSRSVVSTRRWLGAAEMLVAGQIAVSLVLLVGASLFARSLLNLEGQPLGFDREHVLLARINPRMAGYSPTTVEPLYRKLYDRLAALPGIRSATLARYSPLGGGRSANAGRVEGYSPQPGEGVSLETVLVGPSYPETLGMPLVRGRSIGLQDGLGAPKVAMVNEAFVRSFFPVQNPLGRHFGVDGSTGATDIEIVGVLRDVQFQNVREPVRPVVFTALLQEHTQFALDCEIEVRTIGDPAAAARELRAAVADVDRSLPISDVKTLREQVASAFNSQRLAARFVSAFSGLALLLACVGLYGVVAHAVARRTTEIGLRLALGARSRDVLWMILGDTFTLVVAGLVVGIPSAYAAGRLVSSQLYGLNGGDPWSFAFAATVMSVVALIAGLLPARRAARVDPMIALRME
jgi:predicted permease